MMANYWPWMLLGSLVCFIMTALGGKALLGDTVLCMMEGYDETNIRQHPMHRQMKLLGNFISAVFGLAIALLIGGLAGLIVKMTQ